MTRRKRSTRPLLFALAALLALCTGLVAQPDERPDQRADERDVMRVVGFFLERAHLWEHELDDTISQRAFDAYLESLDPIKVYFYASDVEEFATRRNDLDDMMKRGDPTFAHEVFQRFVKRVGERVETVKQLLEGEFDFTKEESFVSDPEAAAWAQTPTEARERWRRRLKLDMLSLRVDEVPQEEIKERLVQRYSRFHERVGKENREEVLSRFINAVATSYDPHTIYLAPKPYEDFEMGVTLNYQGIGALLGEEDGYTVIQRILPGGAAEKQGVLKPEDRIVSVGQGKEGPMVDIVGMRVSDVVKHIRGEEGSVVRLGIMPAGGGPTRVVTLVRQKIELSERAATSRVIEHGKGSEGQPYRIGVIDLPGFYRDMEAERAGAEDFRSSTRDVRRILGEFTEEKVDAVVLDLRRNGGGFLPEAVELTGLFIDKGPVVQVKGGGPRVRILEDEDAGTAWAGPLVVLVSRASASASEIVAGAVKDYRRGIVVGDPATHGKGTVQTPIDLAERIDHPRGPGALGMLKLTLQQFYRPAGLSTQRRGVPSDVVLPSWMDVVEKGEAEYPYSLPFRRIAAIKHHVYPLVDDALIAELEQGSKARFAKSEELATLAKRIGTYRRIREQDAIPLNQKAYMALQAQLDAGRTEAEEDPVPAEGKDETEKRPKPGPWFREVLDITADYLRILERRGV